MAASGTVTFEPAETTQMVTITVKGDLIDEDDERFFVNLSDPTHATLADARGIGTITDDDEPQLSIGDVTVSEGDSGETTAVFPLTLSLSSTRLISVTYDTANNSATAPDDYVAASGTVTFKPLETTQMVTITVNGDLTDEQDEERFFVNLSDATHATLADARGIGTITDDDEPEISIGDVTVSEGDNGETTAVFPLTLSLSSTRLISVAYSTADSSATARDDYAAASGTVTFEPLETTQIVTVTVNGDDVDENNETFFVDITNPVSVTIADAQAVGTISDDDGTPTLTIDDASANEADGSMSFTVRLSAVSALPVEVTYTTNDNTAIAGGDYTSTSGPLTIPPGEISGTLAVNITDDALDEEEERFLGARGSAK